MRSFILATAWTVGVILSGAEAQAACPPEMTAFDCYLDEAAPPGTTIVPGRAVPPGVGRPIAPGLRVVPDLGLEREDRSSREPEYGTAESLHQRALESERQLREQRERQQEGFSHFGHHDDDDNDDPE